MSDRYSVTSKNGKIVYGANLDKSAAVKLADKIRRKGMYGSKDGDRGAKAVPMPTSQAAHAGGAAASPATTVYFDDDLVHHATRTLLFGVHDVFAKINGVLISELDDLSKLVVIREMWNDQGAGVFDLVHTYLGRQQTAPALGEIVVPGSSLSGGVAGLTDEELEEQLKTAGFTAMADELANPPPSPTVIAAQPVATKQPYSDFRPLEPGPVRGSDGRIAAYAGVDAAATPAPPPPPLPKPPPPMHVFVGDGPECGHCGEVLERHTLRAQDGAGREVTRPKIEQCVNYVSAGDNPYASGDVAYTGCSLCGRPRSAHPR